MSTFDDENKTGSSSGPDEEKISPESPVATVENETARAAAERAAHWRAEAIEWVKSIVFALVLALVLRATVVQAYVIPTGSMIPTIMPKDRVFGNRFIYHFRLPQRGDIIAFKPPKNVVISDNSADSLLKRVIGLQDEIVEVKHHHVVINGKPLEEPYIVTPPLYEMPPFKVPHGTIFVMGDNRNDSYDSHMWGPLPMKNIQAKAFLRFWPPNRMGLVK
jgi:signal peptidase I